MSNKSHRTIVKSKDQKLLELEQKVKMLERKNARLEKELELKDMKSDFFDTMIYIADKEYNIDIHMEMPYIGTHKFYYMLYPD